MTRPSAVRFEHVSKRFPGVTALDDVSFEIAAGSCHALCGENGAGKSTLGKILAGIYACDRGQICLDEKPVRFRDPREALVAGVGMVHQELAFCENLSVAENLCLEQIPARGPWVDRSALREQARQRLAAVGADLDPKRRLGELTPGQQQLVQIAAAVSGGARVIVFDEPTSSLTAAEAEHLFALIRRLRAQGVTQLYVSHRLPEVFALCDTVTVLRDGRHVETRLASQVDEQALVRLMIGRPLEQRFPAHLSAAPGPERLRVEQLSSPGRLRDCSLSLHAGEVLGLAGLLGAGRTELAQALVGLDPQSEGAIRVDGARVRIRGPEQALALGLGLVPEDRKRHGLVLSMSARENISLPTVKRRARWNWVRRGAEEDLARTYFQRLNVRSPGMDAPAAGLSGGNQQKLVLAKWLAAQCRILILDEPTRGVDVGAKAEIHGWIERLAREGNAVLLISSDLPELIHLSTRIRVMRMGRMVGEFTRAEATQERLLNAMAGLAETLG